jgi:nitroreductase
MDFSLLINERASVRSYDPLRKVPHDVLMRILEAGRLAPSAANRQPWTFLLIENEPVLSAVKKAYPRDWFHEAPHVIAVCVDETRCWKRSYDGYRSFETDAAIAMSFIILAAANEGVASCWISAFDPLLLREALGLKSIEHVFSITPLGYPLPGESISALSKERKDLKAIFRRA